MTGPAATVLIMAKEPVPGRVKTRLCPPLSPAQAAALATAAIEDTVDAALSVDRSVQVVVALDGNAGSWLDPRAHVIAQRGDSFNARLGAAWSEVEGPAVQIGMDTPQVSPMLLGRAVAALERVDAVLGPALDGGWWALGMRAPDPTVFAGVPMSTARTGARQHAELRRRGWEVDNLEVLRDVDEMADAEAVARAIPASRFARLLSEMAPAAALGPSAGCRTAGARSGTGLVG